MPEIEIIKGGFACQDVRDLLIYHVEDAHANSPEDSSHALEIDELNVEGVQFWHYRISGKLAGFCALKHTDAETGEIKSMRTADEFRRQGLGSFILAHIIEEAKKTGYKKLELETGANDAFKPARKLYATHGFKECSPIKGYTPHPFSMFMRLALDAE